MKSLVRVNFLVEGQTEETFVKDLIVNHLAKKGIYVACRLVVLGSGKGGLRNYQIARTDITNWLSEDKTAYLTTMFDFYGLPKDFPGKATVTGSMSSLEKAEHIEGALKNDIDCDRFLPYIQMHEFESLLFADVKVLDKAATKLSNQKTKMDELMTIRAEFVSPEDINDSTETAPSKRLLSLYPGYQKVLIGSIAAHDTGLKVMREQCSHFSAWLTQIESLG